VNIYSAFYRNWKLEERSALEVFLTHALTDLLNRITDANSALVGDFVFDVMLAGRTTGSAAELSLKKLRKRLLRTEKLRWEPQPGIVLANGFKRRADIGLYSGANPLLIVEGKVSAKLSVGQLEAYGTSLASNYPSESNPGAALIFLTHTTAQPNNFLEEGVSDYGVPLRAVSSWMEVHNSLAMSRFKPKDPFLNRLIEEFRDFMSEHKLNGMTLKDTTFLRKLLVQGVGGKIEPLFKMIRNHVEPRMKKGHNFGDLAPWDYTEGYAVWDFCYRKEPKELLKWYIAWGIMVGGDFFGVRLPADLCGFVVAHRDPDGIKIPIQRLTKKNQRRF
jgi:hypothetical protein